MPAGRLTLAACPHLPDAGGIMTLKEELTMKETNTPIPDEQAARATAAAPLCALHCNRAAKYLVSESGSGKQFYVCDACLVLINYLRLGDGEICIVEGV